jgi:type IV secretory pathway VirD2 relaxase
MARIIYQHFGYVARHGKLAVRSSEGEIIDDPKRLKEIAQDWAMLDEAMNEHGRDRPTSLSLVLSMPGGSADPETLQDAAQAFARILFEDNHAYMLALHTDTDHPHIHLTVATEGADGRRFNPRKADLHHMRETFAHELRARHRG